jgi:hypothetical protein
MAKRKIQMKVNTNESINEAVKSRNEALAALPSPYQRVDDEFLTDNEAAIGALKKRYENNGGILLLTVENDPEMTAIAKIPDKTLMDAAFKKDGQEADYYLLGQCLLYPGFDVIEQWVKSGSPGIVSTWTRVLLKEAKVTVEGKAKKL